MANHHAPLPLSQDGTAGQDDMTGRLAMRFCYADPPYLGQARRHYRNEPTYAGEVDHAALIQRLVSEFPDGWALSASSPSLRTILPLCPENVRVMAWVKPFSIFKPGVGVAYAWEPVIVRGGRKRTRRRLTVRDWTAVNITLRRGLVGAKPEAFAYWLFEVLGMEADDELVDLFPGTGAIGRALYKWRSAKVLTRGVF